MTIMTDESPRQVTSVAYKKQLNNSFSLNVRTGCTLSNPDNIFRPDFCSF